MNPDHVNRELLLATIAQSMRGTSGRYPSEHSVGVVQAWSVELVADAASGADRCAELGDVGTAREPRRCVLHRDHRGRHLAFDANLLPVHWSHPRPRCGEGVCAFCHGSGRLGGALNQGTGDVGKVLADLLACRACNGTGGR